MDPSSPDLSGLRTSDFDVNSWISRTFAGLPEDVDLEKVLEQLGTHLDAEIRKTTATINSIAQQVTVQVPRVAREFELTHNEVNRLQEEITVGFNEAENVQKKTTASMTTLERLDNIKTNLLATSAALQEADKWTSLGKEVEQLLDAGDVHKSYECILGMEKSLSVLDTSVCEERRLILEEVKNRLEALATKHIIHAFETNDIGNASRFFEMFSKLERTTQFIRYFENCEKIKVSQEWRNYVELMSFKDAVTKFFDELLDHLHNKVQWCKTIFKDKNDEFALNILLRLYAETIQSLEPSMQYCLEVEARKTPFLELLMQYNQVTDQFTQNLKQFVDSANAKPKEGVILELLQVLFRTFITQYAKYSKHHETQVVSKIQDAVKALLSSGNIANNDAIAFLQERIECAKRLLPEIILSVKESEEKVVVFNHGYGYYHFGKGVNAGLEKFRDWCHEVVRILDKNSSQQDKNRNLLETSLSFGETCGDILKQVAQLDTALTQSCYKCFSKLNTPSQNEWSAYSEIYLDKALKDEVNSFLQKKETLLSSSVNQLKRLCKDATQVILKVTSEPVDIQLKKNFALTDCNLQEAIPSEYITQVGEYLMLLPQNLDPFIGSEVSSLSYAFDYSGEDDTKSPVDHILSNVSINICEAYTDRLLKISYLSEGQAKQLAQDIEYLGSVLEDLGGKLTQDLQEFSKLMKIYSSIKDSTSVENVSSRILNIVKRMKTVPPPVQ